MKTAQLLGQLTNQELRAYLAKRGIRGPEAQLIREQVAEYKAGVKSMKARRRMVQELWQSVLVPLSAEQRSVRAMLRYESERYPNPQRREALTAYAETLKKLNLKLREYRYYGEHTPKEQAAALKEKGKIIPNNGEHWTDWVPEKVKRAIVDAFNEIPRAAKAKVKVPFPRIITKTVNQQLRATHIQTAKRELIKAEQELGIIQHMGQGHAVEAERDAQAKVRHIQNIINWLIVAEDTEPIPRTWGELNVAELPVVELPVVND